MRNPELECILFEEINKWKEKMNLHEWEIRIAFLNKLYVSHNGYVDHDRLKKKAVFFYDASLPIDDLLIWVSYQMRTVCLQDLDLKTQRCRIRLLELSDFSDYYVIASNPDITIPHGYGAYKDKNKAFEYFKRLMVSHTYAIVLQETNQMIGWIGLHQVKRAVYTLEFGFCVASRYQNKGIGTECVSALIKECFERVYCEGVSANHFVGNIASQKLIEACGLKYEGLLRKSYLHDTLGPMDLMSYSLFIDEYKKKGA